ncbi:glycosyltransferase family A protein [Hymenobacter sp. UYCo722]|uniref:glycosyltransferase family 2 protein n=1 Tax=Hymenobacter sp. UYCo722 TaxID=3156335 RepID=UPI003398C672
MCKVTIVLPVYNVAPHIHATIESLLLQTFKNFELLVLDDCSTDNTVEIVRSFVDPRIKLIVNPSNLGRAGTDNAALEYVQGEYIAKMDGDDICHPERLARQVAYLEQHPEVNVVGSFMQNFGASNYLNRYPAKPVDTQVLTLFTLPTGNPSAMLRASLFKQNGLRYDPTLRQTEDYDFCMRYIRELQIATLQEPLIQYRVPPNSQKKNILSERATVSDVVREKFLQDWQLSYSARELMVYNSIAMLKNTLQEISLTEVEMWLQKIVRHNEKKNIFDDLALKRGLGERWFEVCYMHKQSRLNSIRSFYRSSFADYSSVRLGKKAKLWAQMLLRF